MGAGWNCKPGEVFELILDFRFWRAKLQIFFGCVCGRG